MEMCITLSIVQNEFIKVSSSLHRHTNSVGINGQGATMMLLIVFPFDFF